MTDPYADFSSTTDPYAEFSSASATAKAKTKKPNMFQDMANIAPSALAKGIAATIGLPGDIASILPKNPNDPKPLIPYPSDVLPTSEAINKKLSSALGGYKEAQTVPGQFADTMLQFVPAAATGAGTKKIGEHLATTAAKRLGSALAMGAGSEAGGQLTKGTPLEVPARIAGAVLAGNPKAVAENSKAFLENTKESLKKVSQADVQTVKNEASKLFKQVKEAGVTFSPDTVKRWGNKVVSDLRADGVDINLHPKASVALRKIEKISKSKDAVSFTDLETIRKNAIDALSSPDRPDRRFAGQIIGKIDDFVDGVNPMKVSSNGSSMVDPKALSETITNARQLWKKSIKADEIQNAIDKAGGTLDKVLNLDGNLRREFAKIADSPNRIGKYTAQEKEIIQKIVNGEPVQKVQWLIGKLSPTNPLVALGTLATGGVTSVPVGIGIAAAGAAGKAASTMTTSSNAQKLKKAVMGVEKTKIPYKPVADRRAIIAAQIARQQPSGDQ